MPDNSKQSRMLKADRTTTERLNAASEDDFRSTLDGIWERSPWVVEAAARARPFANREALAAGMWAAVCAAPEERQLALLRAHPDLAGKLAQANALTAESACEQASAGLDRLEPGEFATFTAWNAAYREKFGFPFIICVREHDKAAIAGAFRRRLAQSREDELRIALDEVRRIAEYRLRDRVTI
ncbi:MAG: 2-oxo-4-hydroxy-4-carboxy-5-ureidoimidazoline decarboxylase [Terrimicrobiaceae bacterium]|nr:2-oxo-4-hydroxy-4-carboxy-5-ureidoimidazoline decarboxylase [Terrimicrobiaceae bacterium]